MAVGYSQLKAFFYVPKGNSVSNRGFIGLRQRSRLTQRFFGAIGPVRRGSPTASFPSHVTKQNCTLYMICITGCMQHGRFCLLSGLVLFHFFSFFFFSSSSPLFSSFFFSFFFFFPNGIGNSDVFAQQLIRDNLKTAITYHTCCLIQKLKKKNRIK